MTGTLVMVASAFLLGGALLAAGMRTPGMLVIYFGAQSGFNMYMKIVLSAATVSEELGMQGFPAAFLLTAVQQVVSFVACAVAVAVLWFPPFNYRLRGLPTPREKRAVLFFSLAFAANHGFNNFSLSLLAFSLNSVIRSCIPLMTVLLSCVLRQLKVEGYGKATGKARPPELAFMVIGVFCAASATLAEAEGAGRINPSQHVLLGTLMGFLSIFFAAVNLLCAAELGTELSVNPLDATFYSSIPAAVFLCTPVFSVQHPVWPGHGRLTDWQVFEKVLHLSPQTVFLVLLSGMMSVLYSFLQYWLVRNLSAAYTAFAGNFNKAICIGISILIGLESLPEGLWHTIMILSILGNAGAFAGYGWTRANARERAEHDGGQKTKEAVEDKAPEASPRASAARALSGGETTLLGSVGTAGRS